MGSDDRKALSLIVFGPLFTSAEILFNRQLKDAIELNSGSLIRVTLPQEDCDRYIAGDRVDFDGLYKHNLNNAVDFQLAVAILDGADADSGTCVEVGWRKGRNFDDIIVGVRTDFRASEDGQVNAMLRICDSIIYAPFISINELARKVVEELFAVIRVKISVASGAYNDCDWGQLVDIFDKIRPHIERGGEQ